MRVLIVDHHPLAREGLKCFVSALADRVEVLQGASLADALEQARAADLNGSIDLITLDLSIPGMDGLTGLDRLRQAAPGVPVVVVSAVDDRRQIDAALARGIQGYLTKRMTGTRMVEAFRRVLQGEIYRPPASVSSSDAAPQSRLTRRQSDVLRLLMDGLSNKRIARRLGLSEVTVKAHVSGLIRKLDASNRTHVVRIALERGWGNGSLPV